MKTKTFEARWSTRSEPGRKFYKHVIAIDDAHAIEIIRKDYEQDGPFNIYVQHVPAVA